MPSQTEGLGFRVQKIWAALVIHGDGDEAVPGIMAPNGQWIPLVAADPERLAWLKETAGTIAKAAGKRIVVAEFSVRTDVLTVEP